MRVRSKQDYAEKCLRRELSRVASLRRVVLVKRPKKFRHPFLFNLPPKRPAGGIRGYRARIKQAERRLAKVGVVIGINVAQRLNLRDSAICEVIRGSPDALGLGGILENKTVRGQQANAVIVDYVDKGTHIE